MSKAIGIRIDDELWLAVKQYGIETYPSSKSVEGFDVTKTLHRLLMVSLDIPVIQSSNTVIQEDNRLTDVTNVIHQTELLDRRLTLLDSRLTLVESQLITTPLPPVTISWGELHKSVGIEPPKIRTSANAQIIIDLVKAQRGEDWKFDGKQKNFSKIL